MTRQLRRAPRSVATSARPGLPGRTLFPHPLRVAVCAQREIDRTTVSGEDKLQLASSLTVQLNTNLTFLKTGNRRYRINCTFVTDGNTRTVRFGNSSTDAQINGLFSGSINVEFLTGASFYIDDPSLNSILGTVTIQSGGGPALAQSGTFTHDIIMEGSCTLYANREDTYTGTLKLADDTAKTLKVNTLNGGVNDDLRFQGASVRADPGFSPNFTINGQQSTTGTNGTIGALTITSNVTILAGASYDLDHDADATDTVVVNGTLTLPANFTINANGAGVAPPDSVIFSADALVGSVADWTLSGLSGYTVLVRDNEVILSRIRATVVEVL